MTVSVVVIEEIAEVVNTVLVIVNAVVVMVCRVTSEVVVVVKVVRVEFFSKFVVVVVVNTRVQVGEGGRDSVNVIVDIDECSMVMREVSVTVLSSVVSLRADSVVMVVRVRVVVPRVSKVTNV